MDFGRYATILLSELMIIPAGILCLAPMKNRFRWDARRVLFWMLAVSVILLPASAFIAMALNLTPKAILFATLLICYFAYQHVVTAGPAKALAVYIFVCVIMSVFTNLAHAVDALFNPNGSSRTYTLEFGLFLTGFSTLGTILLFHLLSKYASYLIDQMQESSIWWKTVMISGLFLILNITITPRKYETLYVNNVFAVFIILQVIIFTLELLLGAIFYRMVKDLLALSELKVQNNLAEMQEKAFEKQQRYIEESSRVRHDFKHTIRSIKVMAENGDLEELNRYLDEYVSTFPESAVQIYCKNSALNALLNHYRNQATSHKINIRYNIELPKRLVLSNIELCSIVGNILENAIHAASAQKEGERYIRLTLHVENEKDFYIVAVNSFDGNPVMKNGSYMSTDKSRSGIGLLSITSAVEKHGGFANFHHEGTEFYTDIMVPGGPTNDSPHKQE